MSTYIALFRGINVGGKNTLPMKMLVSLLEDLGCRNARTYIQSGNAVFESNEKSTSRLASKISAEIKKQRGFESQVLLLGFDELELAIAQNPFSAAATEPKSLHVGFLAAVPPNPDLKALESIRAASERFQLIGKTFYLHAPDGYGNSKLAAKAEKLLGVAMTARNWRTVCKINEMATEK